MTAPPHPELTFREARMDGPIALGLTWAMEEEVLARYAGDPGVAPLLRAEQFLPPEGRFLVAWLGHDPVACGGVCRLEDGVAQLRRMFVVPDVRRQGVGRSLLGALEDAARVLAYGMVRLETGMEQPEAMALYGASGYRPIPCFGRYVEDPKSRCFEKTL